MPSTSLVGLAVFGVGAVACTNAEAPLLETRLPVSELSANIVDFGEVDWNERATKRVTLSNGGEEPMGVSRIEISADGMESNFTIGYDVATIVCPEGTETETEAEGEEPEATDVAVDTAWTGDDGSTGSSGGGADTGGSDGGSGASPTGEVFILGAGCELAIDVHLAPTMVGQVYGAIVIESVTEEGESPTYYRDPKHFRQVVMLQGVTVKGEGNVVVRPRTVDLGHLWTGEQGTAQVFVYNVGTGSLVLGEPYFVAGCSAVLELDLGNYDADRSLSAGESTLFEVRWTPDTLDPVYCSMVIPTEDPDSPALEVQLQGNAGDDPENVPPTVFVRSPTPGYRHTTGDPLVLELNVFDANQPANTLICKVKSALLREASLASCTPVDESGYVEVSIDSSLLGEGVDTLKVTVTDQSEEQAYASTSVLWKAPYPASDDDGDGFGEDDLLHPDCDDGLVDTYPDAAEVFDGKDNDCDGGIDEGTEGWDDDGDSVSETSGDCDDADPGAYPGAPESADQKDNDCDGVIDEGTGWYDDDSDGFAEVDNDCDDMDIEVHPAAIELCDGIDNNCNGLMDTADGCVATDSQPLIIGGVQMSETAIGVGESTTMTVFVYDADGQAVSYAWSEDSELAAQGHISIDNPVAKTISWTAPDQLEGEGEGQIFSVYVIASDADSNPDWEFAEITVFAEPVLTVTQTLGTVPEEGCFGGGEGGSEAVLLLVPGLGLALSRRRRRA